MKKKSKKKVVEIKPWKKSYKKWLIPAVIVLVGGAWLFLPEEEARLYTDTAIRTNIDQIVYVTGTVESDLVVDLKFRQSGTVESIYVNEGDEVLEGDMLVELDNDKLVINVNRAKANLDIARADLNLEYAGPTNEEIEISNADIKEAEVNLENGQQKLENTKLINEEEIKTAELEIENAEIALDEAESNYDNALSSGETDEDISDQALADAYSDAKADIIDGLDEVSDALFLADDFLGIDDSLGEYDYEEVLEESSSLSERTSAGNAFGSAQDYKNEANDAYDDIESNWENENDEIEDILSMVESALLESKTVIDFLYDLVNGADPYGTVTQSDLDALASSYALKQSALSIDINAIQSIQQDIENAKLGLTSTGLSITSEVDSAYAQLADAENNLAIKESALETLTLENQIEISELEMDITVLEVKLEQEQAEHEDLIAPPRSVDVAALYARVSRAQADYDEAVELLNDTILLAPADGIVAEINLEEGENVSELSENVVTLMANSLGITTNISESDISKVGIGNTVEMTFDAFASDNVFEGQIVSIDPAETVVQGVIYFEAKVSFDPKGEDVKSGMTANLEVLSASVEDAIAVTPQALNYEDEEIFVFVIEGEERIRKTIQVGLKGDDMVEVLEGLSEGEEVLIYEDKN